MTVLMKEPCTSNVGGPTFFVVIGRGIILNKAERKMNDFVFFVQKRDARLR